MPDAGPQPLHTHTGTSEWKSFEIRMRQRRAERCLLRADMACEAGALDDALAGAEEARRLDPDLPGLAALEARIDAARASQLERRRVRRAPLYAAGAACLVVGFGAFRFLAVAPVEPPAATTMTTQEGAEEAQAPARHRATVGIVERFVTAPVTISTPEPAPRAPAANLGAPIAANRPAEPPPPPRAEPTVTLARGPEAAPLPATSLPVPTVPAPARTTPAPASGDTSAADTRTAPPLAAVEPPPAPERSEPVVDDIARVRAVLSRYEAAYSRLDAAAARAVWPAVDERALARAFNGLESQRVSLERCDVSVSGASARAECAGSATYVPKVGGSGRTEARRWLFDLRQASGAWQIVRAEAR